MEKTTKKDNTIELVCEGVVMDRIPLTKKLYKTIQNEAKEERQPVKRWMTNVLKLAVGLE